MKAPVAIDQLTDTEIESFNEAQQTGNPPLPEFPPVPPGNSSTRHSRTTLPEYLPFLDPINTQTWRGFRSKSSETRSSNLSTQRQNI
jgi:hypothetical protein